MVKNILYLDSKEAMDFFMKSEQYHGFELPEHLVFDELFQDVKETIADTSCVDCLQDKTLPDQFPDIYLYILLNMDEKRFIIDLVYLNSATDKLFL